MNRTVSAIGSGRLERDSGDRRLIRCQFMNHARGGCELAVTATEWFCLTGKRFHAFHGYLETGIDRLSELLAH